MFLRSGRRRDLHGVAPGFQVDKHIKAIFQIARLDDFGAVPVGIKVEVRTKRYPVIESALRLSDIEIDSL
jgi:hypothetical protein